MLRFSRSALTGILVLASPMHIVADVGLPLQEVISDIKRAVHLAENTPGERVGLRLVRVTVDLSNERVHT